MGNSMRTILLLCCLNECHLSHSSAYKVARTNVSSFYVMMNDSYVEVDAHKMSDGGLLVVLGDSAYTVHMKEEVDHYRFVISGKTIVFEKENDPRILRSASPGKLLHFLVEDGGHVDSGQAYAEIEVRTCHVIG